MNYYLIISSIASFFRDTPIWIRHFGGCSWASVRHIVHNYSVLLHLEEKLDYYQKTNRGTCIKMGKPRCVDSKNLLLVQCSGYKSLFICYSPSCGDVLFLSICPSACLSVYSLSCGDVFSLFVCLSVCHSSFSNLSFI